MGHIQSKFKSIQGLKYNNNKQYHSNNLFFLKENIIINKNKLLKKTILKLFEFNSYGLNNFNHQTFKVVLDIKDNKIKESNKWFSINNNYVQLIK